MLEMVFNGVDLLEDVHHALVDFDALVAFFVRAFFQYANCLGLTVLTRYFKALDQANKSRLVNF